MCAIDQEYLERLCVYHIQRKARFKYYSGDYHKQHSKEFGKYTWYFSYKQLFYIGDSIINGLADITSQQIHEAPAPSNSIIGSLLSYQRDYKWDLANTYRISLL